MARSAHTSTSRCMTYLCIHHSNRLENANTGTTSNHSQAAPCRRDTQKGDDGESDRVHHADVHETAIQGMDLGHVLLAELLLAF